jgi:hypothetical protein
MGSTVFNDVAADHWASGYVNVAQAQQIINGYGDGNYGPEDKVTYEQAVKMIVSALGYDLAAQAKGGYPTGYLAIASAEGITKNANGKVGDAAARSSIAVLVYNALEVRLMDQTSWSTGSDGDKYGKTDDTILSKYLEVIKVEGIVTKVPMMGVAVNGYDVDATPEITVVGEYEIWEDNALEEKVFSGAVDSSLVEGNDFLGKSVVAYIGEEEDDRTGNQMVYAIAEAKGKNEVLSISGTQLVESTDSEWGVAGQISYREVGSNKVYDLDLADSVKVYENFKSSSLDENDATSDYFAAVSNGGRLELISNDTDDAIEYILITAYEYEAAIEAVTNEEGIYSFELFKGDLDEIDTEDDEELVIVIIDGEIKTAADLAANMTVSTAEVGNDARILYASSATVTGVVDSYSIDDQEVEIAGNSYELSPLSGITGGVASLKDEEGIFFLNVDGQIAHNESEATGNAKYALVLAVSYETGIKDGFVAQVVTADGTVAEYDLASKAKFNGSGDDTTTADAIADLIEGSNVTLGTGSGKIEVAKLDYANAHNAIFDITIKDGEITKVKTLPAIGKSSTYANADGASANTRDYDAESMTYGSAEFDDNTVVFALEKAEYQTSETQVKDDEVKVGGVADFFTDGDNYNFYTLDVEDDAAPVVLGFNMASSIAKDAAVVVVTGKKTVTYDDDDAVQITGFQDGEEISVIIYDKNNGYTTDPSKLAKGDIILLGNVNSEGVAEDCEMLLNVKADTVANDGFLLAAGLQNGAVYGDAQDEIAHGFGILDKDATTSSKFVIDDAVDYDTNGAAVGGVVEVYPAADGVPMKQSARYTLVDYTESSTNPEVSRKGASSSLFSTNSKYTSYVFVRVYDGALADVVVYRYNGAAATFDAAVTTEPTGAATTDAVITVDLKDATKVVYKVNGTGETTLVADGTITGLKAGDVVELVGTRTGYNAVSKSVTVVYTAPAGGGSGSGSSN